MPRTDIQNEKIRNKRRKNILETSLRLFAINGYKGVSIDDIADEAKCAHSLMYHYFKSKDEIYASTITLAKERLRGLVDSNVTIKTDDPKLVIRTILDNVLSSLKGPHRIRVASSIILLLNTAFEDDEVLGLEKHKRPWNLFLEKIIEGQEKGEFREGDPKEYTATLLAFIRGVAIASIGIKEEYFVVPNINIILRTIEKEENNV